MEVHRGRPRPGCQDGSAGGSGYQRAFVAGTSEISRRHRVRAASGHWRPAVTVTLSQGIHRRRGIRAPTKGPVPRSSSANLRNCRAFRLAGGNGVGHMLAKLAMVLGLALLGTGLMAQARASEPIIHSGGKVFTLAWGGLSWRIPRRLFFGIRTWTENKAENPKELWIQAWWTKKDDAFSSSYTNKHAVLLDVHVRKADSEDPRNALDLIHRTGLSFTKVPIFSSAQFSGMTYIGSSSSFHYFTLNKSHSYISCRLTTAARLKPPKVPADVLSREFACGTVLYLPHKAYAWVTTSGIAINEAAPAFNAAHRLLLSFIR